MAVRIVSAIAAVVMLTWLAAPMYSTPITAASSPSGCCPTPTRDVPVIDPNFDPTNQAYRLTNVHISTTHRGYYAGLLNGRSILIYPVKGESAPADCYPTDVRREHDGWYTYFDGMTEVEVDGEVQYVPLRYWFYYTSDEDAG